MEHISRVTVSMPEETVESMRTIADRKHISFSAVMREACEQYMSSDYFDANQNEILRIMTDTIHNSLATRIHPDLEKHSRRLAYTTKQVDTLLILVAALMSDIMDNGTELENIISKAMLLADRFDGSQIKPNDYYIDKAHRLVTIEDDYGCENP